MFPPGMEDALQQMFGKIIREAVAEAIAPLVAEITDLKTQVELVNNVIETAKARGGFVAKQLLGG